MTKNMGNKTLNERATAGGTAAGIVMVILGFRAKRQNISLVINATITATNNPCAPRYLVVRNACPSII